MNTSTQAPSSLRFTSKKALALMVTSVLGFVEVVEAAQNWSYTYNTNGQVLTADGPRTNITDVTTNTYDVTGNLATVTNAMGHVTQFQNYNGRGQPSNIIDANGIETLLTYHVRGWLLSSTVKEPGGNTVLDATTTYGYDNVGQVISITTPSGTVLNYEYDGAQRLVTISNGLNERIEYTLDAAGNRTKEDIKSDTGTITKTLNQTYDELSRLLQMVGAGGQTITYSYDANGNVIAIVDGNTQTTNQSYDALDRLISQNAPLNSNSSYSFNARDNITSVTDPNGLVTSYSYDGFDNLTQQISPDTGTTNFTYDEANNRITQTDANGVTATYTHDALNRLTGISYPNTALNITYGYDTGNFGKGRLTSITDASGVTMLEYDHRGNVIGQATDVGMATYNMSYSYNLANQLTVVNYPSGRIIDYTYDSAGRVSGASTTYESTTQSLTANLSYQPFGPINQLDYGNGIQLIQAYDLDYRLTDLTHGIVKDSQYSYDNNGNVAAITDNLNASKSQSFTYDALNRLTNTTGAYGTLSYTYDANGNRLTYTDSTGIDNYTYDANSHRLLSTNDWDYAYDNNGNRISKLDAGGSGAGLLYTYDDQNRLIEVKDAQTTTTLASYTYNAYGRRVTKITPIQTTHYVYSLSGQLLTELDGQGNTLREYLYFNGQPIAVTETTTTQNPANPQIVIMDDGDLGVSSEGSWQNKSSGSAYNGDYKLSSKKNRTYRWTPANLNASDYEVYARWPGIAQHNASAQYTIAHNGLTATSTQNQKINGNQWILLGTYDFSDTGNDYLELSDAGGKTAADAVKLVEQITAPPTNTTTTTLYYIHNDHLGTAQVITDESQNIVWGVDYQPFGEVSIHVNTIANNLRFPGQYFDEESNLHYNYYRDYEPSTGRYIQADPRGVLLDFGDPLRIVALRMGISALEVRDVFVNHSYGYVDQNPLNFIDPTGEFKGNPISDGYRAARCAYDVITIDIEKLQRECKAECAEGKHGGSAQSCAWTKTKDSFKQCVNLATPLR